MFVAGAIVLILNGELLRRRTLMWCVAGVFAIGSYFYRYVNPADHPSVVEPITNDPVGYMGHVLALLGGVFTENVAMAIVIGSILFGFVVYLTVRKYFLENPIIYALMIFLMLTSVAGSAARFGFGIEQALVSRYTIISALLVVSCYLAFVPLVQDRFNAVGWIAILAAATCFHYGTYGQYLPDKKTEKAEFERDQARILRGQLSHFGFGWPPLDRRRQLPRQMLRAANSLGYFPFWFRDEAEVLESMPTNANKETAHAFERFQQIGPAVIVFSGWGLIRGLNAEDVIPVLCFKDEQGNARNYIVLQAKPRPDVMTKYAGDRVDYTMAGFETVFNRAEIKPGKYHVTLYLVATDFKVAIDAGPTTFGQ